MRVSLSDALLKSLLMAGAFCCAALLLRDSFAIGLHVPLDPNEGWNAYHAMAAMAGHGLYPHDWMANNYPPLSFYVIGMLGKSLGDFVIAGRLVSLVSFLTVAMGLAVLVRQLGGQVLDGIFAALLFAAALLIASDYVAMNDPQLLGHALEIEALILLLRERPETIFAALLLAAALFIKQNLFAVPLAMFLWLWLRDRREAIRLGLYIAGIGVAALIAAWALLDANLLTEMAAPRLWSLNNASSALSRYLSWAGLPLALTAAMAWQGRRDPWMGFCALYGAIALLAGAGFSAGDGVDANIFFDLDIAMALATGLAMRHLAPRWRGLLTLAYAAPLALFLGRHFQDDNFGYTEGFQRQGPLDVAFVAMSKGPALCENLALCYWADKPAEVDVFNMSERFKTGARSADGLAALVQARHYGVIQLESLQPFALGENTRTALAAAYRVHHIDDNGVFLVPR
jgi:hypothetical protein